MTIGLSAFRSARDRKPSRHVVAPEVLLGKLSTFKVRPVADKLDLPAWSPAIYAPGQFRAKANVEAVSCIVLDVDDGTPLDTVWALWPEHPRVLHTSWSHTPEHPKCRLVVPLEQPIPREGWSRVWYWAAKHARLRHVAADQQCKDPSRIFFAPSLKAAEAAHESRVQLEGPRLAVDWRKLPDPEEARRAAARAAHPPVVELPGERLKRGALYRDPVHREDLARRLDATIRDGRATRIPCPGCGRNAVWFWFEPDKAFNAYCDHRNTCGWTGSLAVLG